MDKLSVVQPQVDRLSGTPDLSMLPEGLRQDVEATFEFLGNTIADSTQLTYRRAWLRFCSWAAKYNLPSLPASPETICAYASHLAKTEKKYATIGVAVSAIGSEHSAAGFDPNPIKSPKVRLTLLGISRTIGTGQKQKKDLSIAELRKLIVHLPTGILGIRDRALLLLWYTCASRRSEPCSLSISDLEWREDGLSGTFQHTKTDQTNKGLRKGVPYSSGIDRCPVRAVKAWVDCLHQHGFDSGPLFRAVRGTRIAEKPLTPAAAVLRIKHYAELSGIDPKKVSGHSMRSGFATAAARSGKTLDSIMAQTGHLSTQTVMKYIRRGKLISESAAVGLLDSL